MSPLDTPTNGASVNSSVSAVEPPSQKVTTVVESEPALATSDDDQSNSGKSLEDETHVVLTRDMVVSKNVLKMDQMTQSQSDIDQQLQSISHVRLDRLQLVDVGFLAGLPHITNLYLQHNNLTTTAGLASLNSLRFLTLAHNRLSTIADLCHLPRLILLDLSNNRLPSPLSLHIPHLPTSLVFLDISGNPCTLSVPTPDLVGLISPHLPALDELNGQAIAHTAAGADDDAHHDRPDDDEDFLAYLTYAGTADHVGASSLLAGSVSTLIESARHGADPVTLAVASRAATQGSKSGTNDPGVLKVAAFNVTEVREAVVGTLRRAGGVGRRNGPGGEAAKEYSARVEEVKQRFGFGSNVPTPGEPRVVEVPLGDGTIVVEDDETGFGGVGNSVHRVDQVTRSQVSLDRVGPRVGPP